MFIICYTDSDCINSCCIANRYYITTEYYIDLATILSRDAMLLAAIISSIAVLSLLNIIYYIINPYYM